MMADDFRGGGQFDQDFFDDPEGEYEGEDEEMDEEEQAAMEEALALNEQLRQMLELQAQQEQQEQGLVRRAPGGPMQQQQRRMMPAQDPGPQGKKKSNYTFDKHEMEAMGSENQRLLNRMIAIKTNRDPGKGAGFSYNQQYSRERHVAAASINRRKRDDQIARENMKIANRLRNVSSTSQRQGGVRSSGYSSRPWQPPKAKKKSAPKKLVLPEWNS